MRKMKPSKTLDGRKKHIISFFYRICLCQTFCLCIFNGNSQDVEQLVFSNKPYKIDSVCQVIIEKLSNQNQPLSDTISIQLNQKYQIAVQHLGSKNYYLTVYSNSWDKINRNQYEGLVLKNKITYYENGQVEIKIQWSDGKIYVSWYYDDGFIKQYKVSNEDTLIAEIGFFKTGQIEFIHSRLEGSNGGYRHKWFDKGGNTLLDIVFAIDSITPRYCYYPNGKIQQTGHIYFFDYAKVGEWKEYYPSGKLHRVYNYSTAEPIIPNIKDGEWKWYDEKGNLIKRELYRNNLLVK